MEHDKDITYRAFTILAFFFMIGTSILIAPVGLAQAAKQDAWLAALLGVALNVGFVGLYVLIAERHPGQSFVGIGESLLGRWPGRLVGLAFALFCLLLASLMVGDMGYFLTAQILIDTPTEFLQLIFVCAIVIAVAQGMKGLSYAAEFFFPWIVLLLLIFIVLLLPDLDTRQLMPVLEFGAFPVLKGGAGFFAFQELVVLLMLYPRVKPGKGRGKGFLIGTALGGVVLVFITFGSICILDTEMSANYLYPAFTMAKNIKIGRFLERVEGVIIFIWICSIFMKIALTFHAALAGLSESLRISDSRVLQWPMAMGLVVLSLICYPSAYFIRTFLSTCWLPLSSIFMVLLPVVFLAVSLLRGKAASDSR